MNEHNADPKALAENREAAALALDEAEEANMLAIDAAETALTYASAAACERIRAAVAMMEAAAEILSAALAEVNRS